MSLNYTPKDLQRFWSKVEKSDNCWNWTAFKDKLGYGRFHFGTRCQQILAHRFSYELFRGDIPKGLTLDHLCRNPSCVNPDHLEAVTQKVNVLRGIGCMAINAKKTHCPKGHELTENNLDRYQFRRAGWRICRQCKNQRMKES